MTEFRMPSLGADMEAGTLVEWLVQPGGHVAHGDIIAVVETQKGAIEIEVFQDGTVESLLVEPGTTVPVGTPLAMISGGADTPVEPAPEQPTTEPPVSAISVPAEAPIVPPRIGQRVRASPAARKLAAEQKVDLTALSGSGAEGTVLYADVKRTRQREPRAAESGMTAMRTAIAAAMARSKREIPHYYLEHQIDVTAVREWLETANAERAPAERLLGGAVHLKAIALALRKFPELNGFFEDARFRPSDAIHVGAAISIRGGGLVAPAIHDTDTLSLDQVMARLRDLTKRVRSGRFRSSELADPTVTVSSLGERGVGVLFGVIYPPQVALIGVGRVEERPWLVGGSVEPRTVITATLAADHRVSDGHRGALFLRQLDDLLQHPEAL